MVPYLLIAITNKQPFTWSGANDPQKKDLRFVQTHIHCKTFWIKMSLYGRRITQIISLSCWIARILDFRRSSPARLSICAPDERTSTDPWVLKSRFPRCTRSAGRVTVVSLPWPTPRRSPSEATLSRLSFIRG